MNTFYFKSIDHTHFLQQEGIVDRHNEKKIAIRTATKNIQTWKIW